jgi:hypothetical protein
VSGERRRAVAFLPYAGVARALALPEGMNVVAVQPDFLRDGFSVLVEGSTLDPVPENIEAPRIDVAQLDRSELAMRAEVRSWESEGVTFIEVYCPAGCPWEHAWEHERSLAQMADVVKRHLDEAHAS